MKSILDLQEIEPLRNGINPTEEPEAKPQDAKPSQQIPQGN